MKEPSLLSRREVAEWLGRPVDYASGAVEALKLPQEQVGPALCTRRADLKRIAHLRRDHEARAAS